MRNLFNEKFNEKLENMTKEELIIKIKELEELKNERINFIIKRYNKAMKRIEELEEYVWDKNKDNYKEWRRMNNDINLIKAEVKNMKDLAEFGDHCFKTTFVDFNEWYENDACDDDETWDEEPWDDDYTYDDDSYCDDEDY